LLVVVVLFFEFVDVDVDVDAVSDVDSDCADNADNDEEDCGVAVLKHTCVLLFRDFFEWNDDSDIIGMLDLFLFLCRCIADVRALVDFDDDV
jgi:hypothetical protein